MPMDPALFEAARAIRPHLPDLLGEDAPSFDRRLVELLGRAQGGDDVDEGLADLLAGAQPVLDWTARVLEDERHRPPGLQGVHGRDEYAGPLGSPGVIDADKYICPVDGLYVWYRMGPGDQVRKCPDHRGVVLVPA